MSTIYCNGCKQHFATLPDYDLHDCYIFSQECEPEPKQTYPSYRELLQRAVRHDPLYARYATCTPADPLGIQQTIDYFRPNRKRHGVPA